MVENKRAKNSTSTYVLNESEIVYDIFYNLKFKTIKQSEAYNPDKIIKDYIKDLGSMFFELANYSNINTKEVYYCFNIVICV